jgi:hypothetical protein
LAAVHCFVFFVADGSPAAVDTLTGFDGATVSVPVGATAVVPGVTVVDVSVFVTPVLLWAVSVLTTSRCPHAASIRAARTATIHFMTAISTRILTA